MLVVAMIDMWVQGTPRREAMVLPCADTTKSIAVAYGMQKCSFLSAWRRRKGMT